MLCFAAKAHVQSHFWNKLAAGWRRFGDRLADVLGGSNHPDTNRPRTFGLAAVFGIVALVGSGWIVLNTIQRLGRPVVLNTGSENANLSLAQFQELQAKDTDGDGLSDYQELFALKTSPYLQDSDSDGVSDRDEVIRNTDPNCPAGQSCTGVIVSAPAAGQELTPEFLRQALRESGVAQSVLDNLPNDQLLLIYQQILSEGGASNTNSGPTLESLQSLDGAGIRKLLLQSGVSQSELDQINDATLKQIFNEAIASDSHTQ